MCKGIDMQDQNCSLLPIYYRLPRAERLKLIDFTQRKIGIMHSFKHIKSVLAVAFLLAGFGLNAGSFTNGSFEIPVVSSGTALNLGDTWLTGWTVGGSGEPMGVWHGSTGGLSPVDGRQWVYFGGINAASGGSLSQTFGTVVGQPYGVTYYVGESGTGGPLSLTGTAMDAVGSLLASNQCVSVSGTGFSVEWVSLLQPPTPRWFSPIPRLWTLTAELWRWMPLRWWPSDLGYARGIDIARQPDGKLGSHGFIQCDRRWGPFDHPMVLGDECGERGRRNRLPASGYGQRCHGGQL